MTPYIAVPRWKAPTWERTAYYMDSVAEAGGHARLVDEKKLPPEAIGLVLMGGVDVNPKLYHEKRGPHTDKPHEARDEHELGLLEDALTRDLPVLAICRGHQLLNVALGGSLVQDVEGGAHKWLENGESGWHEVSVVAPGRLAGVFGEGSSVRVNSRHHQAVTLERLADGLQMVITSADGLVEGMESDSQRWVVGVQWHPERPEMREDSRGLFGAFVAACRRAD